MPVALMAVSFPDRRFDGRAYSAACGRLPPWVAMAFAPAAIAFTMLW
jgi:Na+/melibiose symporter-like transporter